MPKYLTTSFQSCQLLFSTFLFCVLGFAVCRQSLSSSLSVSTVRHTIFVSSGSEKAVERMLVIRQPFSRRRRDLNPRAATNDLLPFQGSPFNHLGTSALVESHPISGSNMKFVHQASPNSAAGTQAERVGFEPTRPCGQTVFKTASL